MKAKVSGKNLSSRFITTKQQTKLGKLYQVIYSNDEFAVTIFLRSKMVLLSIQHECMVHN